jgi:ABC-2 type transport system ATP-binding protein
LSQAPEKLAIDVRGLKKSFDGKVAVDGVDLRVRTGEVFGFLGPNGSGKTTTIRMICGLLRPDAGEGTVLGYDVIKDSAEIKKHIGYMTQRFSLYDELTIEENLLFVGRMYLLKNLKAAVTETLRELGLTERKNQLAGTLSGGWKQRLALAACIMHGPQLLLLDEPTAGVDPKARRAFWDDIHQLAGQGITALVSTHYMDEAERCHRLAYISHGRLIAHGTAETLVGQSHLKTWLITGDNLFEAAEHLSRLKGVETVAAFGSGLHVSGADETAMAASLKPFLKEHHLSFTRVSPTLEDVFIHFMRGEGPGEGRDAR